jgi:hypothetical protein
MQKNYRIDGSVGEIKNSLEDIIQGQNGVALRELSFEELTNFIPKKDFLAETINGVKLEYLIKNESSKTFSSEVKGEQILFHIFQDKIITTFPFFSEVKILVDTIRSEIEVNVSAISSCFKISDKEGDRIVFNSTSGVYFCTITSRSPFAIPTGGSYFTKIEIPSSLTGEQITSITRNVYYYNGVKEYNGQAFQSNTLQEHGTGFYLEDASLNIGDIIKCKIKYWVRKDLYFEWLEAEHTFKVIRQLEGIKLKSSNGLDLIFPFTIRPPEINITSASFGTAPVPMEKNVDLIYNNNFSNIVKLLELELFTNTGGVITTPPVPPSLIIIGGGGDTGSVVTQPPNPGGVITTPPVPPSLIIIGGSYYEPRSIDNLIWKGVLVSFFLEEVNNLNLNANLLNLNYTLSYASTTSKRYVVARSCLPTYNTKINIIQTSVQSQVKQVAPYTPYSVDGRLAVSYLNIVKFSKTGNYTDFNFNPQATPTETDAFERVLQDVSEITFISNWSSGNEKGFVLGTTKELLYFSSIANIFSTTITDRKPIPCSYIPPLKFNINNITSNIIVEAGRTKITGVVPTREQVNNINLTQYVDFFKNDPIKKIQGIAYDDDRLLFVLTDGGRLYGCLTGGSILAWFRIQLKYQTEDITTIDDGFNKKLFITSVIRKSGLVPTNQKLIGSIDFTEGVNQIKAEYFIDNSLQDDNVFSEQIPTISRNNAFMLKSELTNEEKQQLPKPMVARMTLHNQEVINSKVNTKASKVKRKISNVNVNVRNSNNFKIQYIYQDNNKKVITKTAYDIQKIDDFLNPKRVKELIEVFRGSPIMDNVKLSIETNEKSIVPLIIQSISFDTEYVNIK